jgi:hypothetical protein
MAYAMVFFWGIGDGLSNIFVDLTISKFCRNPKIAFAFSQLVENATSSIFCMV